LAGRRSGVTAEDIKWNFDFINSTQAPEYTPIISPIYQGCEVVHDYLLKIYINGTGFFKAQEFLGSALVYPRQVWEPFWGDYTGASSYKPWTEAGPNGLPTKLYGTGPWILEYWDEVSTAKINKNVNYWARLASSQNVPGVMGALRARGKWTCPACGLPLIYGTNGLEVQLMNINPFNPIDVEYYVEMVDITTGAHIADVIGSADSPKSVSLNPFQVYRESPEFAVWKDKALSGDYKFKLWVRIPGGDWEVKYEADYCFNPGNVFGHGVALDDKVRMNDVWVIVKDIPWTGNPEERITDVIIDGKVRLNDAWAAVIRVGATHHD